MQNELARLKRKCLFHNPIREWLSTTRELSRGGSHGATISYGPSLLPAVSIIYFNYFSISEAQFNVMAKGATLASSTFVRIKNLCPSPLTS
jgi:hypothetical protein